MRPALLVVAALAVAIRLAFGLFLLSSGDRGYVLSSDDGDAYVASALHVAEGQPITLDDRLAAKWPNAANDDPAERWPQAYWLLLAAQYRLFGYQHVSTIVLQALLGGLTVLAGYSVARRMLPATAALVSAALIALSSTLIVESAALYAEALYIPLLLGAVALLPTSLLAAGAAFGLAEATRPLALPVLLVAALWTMASRTRNLIPLLGGFALAIAPFVARDLLVLGHTQLFTVGGQEAFVDLHQTTSGLLDRAAALFITGGWIPIGEPFVSSTPAIALASRALFWLLTILGLSRSLRTCTAHTALLLATTAAIVLPPLLLGLPLVRYRTPADPIFLIWFTTALTAYTGKVVPTPRRS